jgi:hypothetical protein
VCKLSPDVLARRNLVDSSRTSIGLENIANEWLDIFVKALVLCLNPAFNTEVLKLKFSIYLYAMIIYNLILGAEA